MLLLPHDQQVLQQVITLLIVASDQLDALVDQNDEADPFGEQQTILSEVIVTLRNLEKHDNTTTDG